MPRYYPISLDIEGKTYDLEPGKDPAVLEYRSRPDEPAIRMTVDAGKALIDVKPAPGKEPPKKCELIAFEIVRDGRTDPGQDRSGNKMKCFRPKVHL